MSIFMSLSVERIHVKSQPFWPPGTQRLVVIVSSPDLDGDTFVNPDSSGDLLVADVVDPDHDHVVFRAELQRAQLNAFIKAVIDGATPVTETQRVGTDSRISTTTILRDGKPQHGVIVPDPTPPHTPVVEIRAVISSANADLTATQHISEASMDVAIS
jgi:hypothetical protein